MRDKKLSARRRRWKRFNINGSAIVMLHKPRLIDIGKPSLVQLGPVVDISMGGLSVQYFENKKRKLETDTLSIHVPDQGLVLEGMKFDVISDRIVAKLAEEKIIRSRCVSFRDQSRLQSYQLETFMKQFTLNSPADRRTGRERRRHVDPRFDDDAFRSEHERRDGIERRRSKATIGGATI